ncbi:hypothetical protein TNCV_1516051 [Trichonephila clavipes]|nr:hypothetical protein TNCV_1516051 [Trichonephila clavipes]
MKRVHYSQGRSVTLLLRKYNWFEEVRSITGNHIPTQTRKKCLFQLIQTVGDCGSPVVKVLRHVMSSSPVPPKTLRVGQRCTLNPSRAETSSRWCGC